MNVLTEELRNYSHKREEARRQADLDEALISALQVSEEASHIIQKSGPPRLVGLVIIGVFSVIFSCALAIYRESSNTLVSLSPLDGYGDSRQSFNRADRNAELPAEDNYTILSGRLTSGAAKYASEHKYDKSKVHVTENIRG